MDLITFLIFLPLIRQEGASAWNGKPKRRHGPLKPGGVWAERGSCAHTASDGKTDLGPKR